MVKSDMNVKSWITKSAERDMDRIKEYLAGAPESNAQILAYIHYYGFYSDFQNLWILEEPTGIIRGVMLRYFDEMHYYARSENVYPSAVCVFFCNENPHTIIARAEIAGEIYRYLTNYTRGDKYMCALRNPDKLVADHGGVAFATTADAPAIAVGFSKIPEFGIVEPQDDRAWQIANRIRSGEGVHAFILRDGVIAAHGNTSGTTEKTAIIGGVYTMPKYRRNGFASQIVSVLARHLLAAGRMPLLLYDNPSAGSIYQKLGFTSVDKITYFTKN
jgi:predicted GNAT family acetyltransferase